MSDTAPSTNDRVAKTVASDNPITRILHAHQRASEERWWGRVELHYTNGELRLIRNGFDEKITWET